MDRNVFSCPLQEDAVISRLMRWIITNICERLPVDLPTIDKKLRDLIVSTASRHAGISTHTLPPVKITAPSGGAIATVEMTVSVLYEDSFDNSNIANTPSTSSFVQERAIRIPLHRVPDRPPLKTPPTFILPADPKMPVNTRLTKVTIQRTIKTIQWVQSHIHSKVFKHQAAFDDYVEFLIQSVCLADEELQGGCVQETLDLMREREREPSAQVCPRSSAKRVLN